MNERKANSRKSVANHTDVASDNRRLPDQATDRQKRLLFTALLSGTTVGLSMAKLPSRWSRPIVDSVLLPAHAQATCGALCASSNVFDFVALDATAIDVSVRIPSGGPAVTAMDRVQITLCGIVPGIGVNVQVLANLNPAGQIDLGSNNTVTATGNTAMEVSVSPTIVAPVSDIRDLTLVVTSEGVTGNTLVPAAQLNTLVMGGTSSLACPF